MYPHDVPPIVSHVNGNLLKCAEVYVSSREECAEFNIFDLINDFVYLTLDFVKLVYPLINVGAVLSVQVIFVWVFGAVDYFTLIAWCYRSDAVKHGALGFLKLVNLIVEFKATI